MSGTLNAPSSAPQNEAAVMMSEPIVAAYKAFFVDLPLTVTNEALRFMAHRLQKQAKFVSELSSCKTLFEATQAQSAFFRSALGDYRKEAGTVVHRVTNAIS
jgi:hypothetical protein